MFMADLSSRPAGIPSREDRESAPRVEMHVYSIIQAEEMFDDLMLDEIRREDLEDRVYQQITEQVRRGRPLKRKSYRSSATK